MEARTRDVVIVGAGPAGVAAAVQLVRYGITPLVFERHWVGGLLRTAWSVENHPGFPHGIRGPELAEVVAEHLESSGAELAREEVKEISLEHGGFAVRSSGRQVLAGHVIVASGTRALTPEDLVVPDTVAARVHHESRELWDESDAAIAVVGGGDAAFDYTTGLAASNDVTIFVRGEPRCLPLLGSRVARMKRARVVEGTKVSRVAAGKGGRIELELKSLSDPEGEPRRESFDRLLLAVGREPEDSFLSEEVLARSGELAAANRLLFAGDVRSGVFRQSSIASGLGTLAAMRLAMGMREQRGSAGHVEDRTEHL